MEDFTGSAIHDQPEKRSGQWRIDPPFDRRVRELVRDWDDKDSPELIEEMIVTALKIARDQMSVADLKLINRSIKELRYSAKIFAPFQHLRKVAIFGSARTPPDAPDYKVAKDFAREMVAHNFMVITGGGDGIMGAAQQGAGRARSFGLNIRLPAEQRANKIIEGDSKLITLNYFFIRKLNFVKEAQAFALFPGGFGTLDETFEVLTLMQTGKARIIPVVLLDRPRGSYWEVWMKFMTDHLLKLCLISEEDFPFSRSRTTSRKRSRKSCSSTKSIIRHVGWTNDSSFGLMIGCRKEQLPFLTRNSLTSFAKARSSRVRPCLKKRMNLRFGICRD